MSEAQAKKKREQTRLELWDRLRTANSMWLTGFGSVYQMTLTPDERLIVLDALYPSDAANGEAKK